MLDVALPSSEGEASSATSEGDNLISEGDGDEVVANAANTIQDIINHRKSSIFIVQINSLLIN